MDRRNFTRNTAVVAGAYVIADQLMSGSDQDSQELTWFNKPMRWAQLTLVENDPGSFDPDFWIDYFKRVNADGSTLSAGGIVAYYPTSSPLHQRNQWLGNSDPFGYLRENGKGRIVYFPNDIDRSFWQIMSADHSRLLRNTILRALNEDPLIEVNGPGVMDITMWRQKNSMTVHLVNLTNPMMIKGPFRELISVSADVKIRMPEGIIPADIKLQVSGETVSANTQNGAVILRIPKISDHEIIGIDL